MTGNVAQVFLTDAEWAATLRAAYAALRPGGHLVFETRDPAAKAWLEWNRERSYQRTVVAGVGPVLTWGDVLDVSGDLVSFRTSRGLGPKARRMELATGPAYGARRTPRARKPPAGRGC